MTNDDLNLTSLTYVFSYTCEYDGSIEFYAISHEQKKV